MEGQKVDASVLLRRKNKTLMGGTNGTEEQGLEKRPSRECLTWGSTPYSPNKPTHYCWCQAVLTGRNLIWMPSQRLCQSHTDKDEGTPMKELEKGLKELKGSATPREEQNYQLTKPTTAIRDLITNQWVHMERPMTEVHMQQSIAFLTSVGGKACGPMKAHFSQCRWMPRC